jgi:hypothetical protein
MPDEIIVTGGSVTIEFSESALTHTASASPGKLKFTADGLKLASLLVNGKEVQPLDQSDVVTIVCEDADGLITAEG